MSLGSISGSPRFTIAVVATTIAGDWDQPYHDGSPLTIFRSSQREGVLRLMDRILSNHALADRVRSLEIEFHYETSFAEEFRGKLRETLGMLPKLESLTLNGCLDFEYGLIDTPVRFPHLTALTCDFPISTRLERFLVENPTITDLSYGGADMQGDVGPGSRLCREALPNLTYLQCDIWLLSFFLPGRPISWAIPLNYPNRFDNTVDFQIQALKHSTADNGVAEGGGVKRFCLSAPYPLQQLADAAPNLQQLQLEEEDLNIGVLSLSEDVAARRFWTTPDWERDLALFQRLRKITVTSMEEIVHEEQRDLVRRWTSSSIRPKTLARITFEHWGPQTRQRQRRTIETTMEFRDGGSHDAGVIPELIYDDPHALSESDSDETLSVGGSDDASDVASFDLDHPDVERAIDSDSSDSSASSEQSRTRWWWNQEAAEWHCSLDM